MQKNIILKENFHVFTGGPGVGKTSLLLELEKLGYPVIAEDARKIIKEQVHIGGDALPWKDREKYMKLMFYASVESFYSADTESNNQVLFDRGIIDSIGYAHLSGLKIPDDISDLAKTIAYHQNVFMLPPWIDIFENDAERQQTWQEAVDTFDCLKDTYLNYGYRIIEVPKISLQNRVRFILKNILS